MTSASCDASQIPIKTRNTCYQLMNTASQFDGGPPKMKALCAFQPAGVGGSPDSSAPPVFYVSEPGSPYVGQLFQCKKTCFDICFGKLVFNMFYPGQWMATGQCAKYWKGPTGQKCDLVNAMSFREKRQEQELPEGSGDPAPAPAPRIALKSKDRDQGDECWNLSDYDACASPSKTWQCRWNFESQRCKPLQAALKAGNSQALLDYGDACMDHKECASKKCMLKDEVFQCVHESMDMSCSHDDDCSGSTCMCGSLKCCCGNYCTGDNPFQ